MIDSKGSAIGIVVSTLNQSAMLKATGNFTQNVNYAIKISYAMPMLLSHNIQVINLKSTRELSKVDLVGSSEESVVLVIAE